MKKEKKNDSDSVFGDKYLKTEIKSNNKTINTNFKNADDNSTKPPEEGDRYICMSVIGNDSAFKSNKS